MTVSGKTVYNAIIEKERAATNQDRGYTKLLGDIESSIDALEGERLTHLSHLAGIYIPELTESVLAGLQGNRDKAKGIYEQKMRRREALDREMEGAQGRKEQLLANLNTVTKSLDEKGRERDAAQTNVAQELEKNSDYVGLRTQAEPRKQAYALAEKSAEYFVELAKRQTAKFEGNNRFLYLAQASAGNPKWEPTSAGDRLVSEIVGFRRQRANYAHWKSLPGKLAEGLALRRARLEELVREASAIEKAAGERHGLFRILEAGEALMEKRRLIQGQMEKADAAYSALAADREALNNSKDKYHAEALSAYAATLGSMEISQLKHMARSTPGSEDDRLVDRVEQIDAEIIQYKAQAKAVKAKQAAAAKQAEKMSAFSAFFTKEDYESDRSYFPNDFDIDAIVAALLANNMSLDSARDTISSSHKRRPRETYTPTYAPSRSSSTPRRSSDDDDDDGPGLGDILGGLGGLGGGGGGRSSIGSFGGGGRSSFGGFGGGGGGRKSFGGF